MSRGFTLIELVLAFTIIAGLGVLSAVFYTRFLTQNNVATVQDQIFGALRKAHTYSLVSRNSTTSGWGVHKETAKITLFLGATYLGRNPALDESFTFAGSITVSGFPASNDITFARVTGLPNPSGTTTITITGTNGISKQITINGQGVASRN